MATTDPLTGATIYAQTDAALGGQQLGDVVTDLRSYTVPRFTSTSTRDTAYTNFVAAGGTLVNGMVCWCDSPGSFYDRDGGAWVPRAKVDYGTGALDGTTIPANARLLRLRKSNTTTVTNTSGGFGIGFGVTFTKLVAVALWAGDNTGPLGFIVPIVANHTVTSAQGIAYQPNGTVVANGTTIRVEIDVVGYLL